MSLTPLPSCNQVLEECESTNGLAKKWAEADAPHGTWISAKTQTSGRGRLGRRWESLTGNLFLSVVLRFEHKTVLSWVPLAAAVAVCKVVQIEFPALSINIKWPNDLWIKGKKVGGILCEGASGSRGLAPYVVVGVGLNTAVTPELASGPEQNSEQCSVATDLESELHLTLPRGHAGIANRIRILIVEQILREIEELNAHGPSQIRDFYQAFTLTPVGTAIEWGTPAIHGVVEALGDSGELKVRTDQGQVMSLYAEEIRKFRKASYGSRP